MKFPLLLYPEYVIDGDLEAKHGKEKAYVA